jgi:Resolvase, N terminal domain
MFQMMGVFAEFERATIQERVRAGMARAKAEGVRLGRPKIQEQTEATIRRALKKKNRPGLINRQVSRRRRWHSPTGRRGNVNLQQADVCSSGQSGRDILGATITPRDPLRTSWARLLCNAHAPSTREKPFGPGPRFRERKPLIAHSETLTGVAACSRADDGAVSPARKRRRILSVAVRSKVGPTTPFPPEDHPG